MKIRFMVLVLGSVLLLTAVAQSKVFYSVKALLSEQFKSSKRVSFVRVDPEGKKRAAISKRLLKPLPKKAYSFYVAKSGDHVDGYALFDSELGQHEPIDFATFFDKHGKVTRVEVVAYREAYGEGIRSAGFRNQFVGRNASSGYRPRKDIDIVSGATISSKSMAVAVQRAAVLLKETVLEGAP